MRNQIIRFVTMFPFTNNTMLLKDVGMIPYTLHNNYGWDCSIACYNNEENGYPYLNQEVKGLRIDYIDRKYNNVILDGLRYIRKTAKEIDILQLYHVTDQWNFPWVLEYMKLNPRGKVYLKLDAGFEIRNQKVFGRLFSGYRKKVINKVSLLSAESASTVDILEKRWRIKPPIITVGNGVYRKTHDSVSYNEKKNIILHVARMGTKQKDTVTLLKGFCRYVSEQPNTDWKLRLVGTMERTFEKVFHNYVQNNNLSDKVEYAGVISDPELLEAEYRRAKIFLLSSRWEAFPIAPAEALIRGAYLILSDFECAHDLTNWGEFGRTYSIEDYIGLARCLERVCANEELLRRKCEHAQRWASINFDWNRIVVPIYNVMK